MKKSVLSLNQIKFLDDQLKLEASIFLQFN